MIFSFFFFSAVGCTSKWSVPDIDGDGVTVLDGDCWDSLIDPVPPTGAINHGITALDIYPGALDLPYDGIDANCDGANDFDQDNDGFVPSEYVGIQTIGLETADVLPGGDCWDVNAPLGPSTLTGMDIHPNAI